MQERYFRGEATIKNAAAPRCHFEFVKWNAEQEGRDSKGTLARLASLGAQSSVSLINSHASQLNLGNGTKESVSLEISVSGSEWHIITKL